MAMIIPRVVAVPRITAEDMTFALPRCHVASGRISILGERAAAGLVAQCIVIIPISAILPWTIVECSVALIG